MPQPWPAVSPDQTRLTSPVPGGRGAEVVDDRLALDASVVQVLEADAVEDVLAGREAVEVDLGGEVASLVGEGTQEPAR